MQGQLSKTFNTVMGWDWSFIFILSWQKCFYFLFYCVLCYWLFVPYKAPYKCFHREFGVFIEVLRLKILPFKEFISWELKVDLLKGQESRLGANTPAIHKIDLILRSKRILLLWAYMAHWKSMILQHVVVIILILNNIGN